MNKNSNKGFTLAEVLITLGIIGVVAALTLPTLISSYKKHEVETRIAKFYSVINQAVKLSEIDNGDCSEWNFPASNEEVLEWYNKYLSKYMKTTKVKAHEDKVQVFFPDGSLVLIERSMHIWFFPDGKKFFNSFDDEVYANGRDKYFFTFLFFPKEERGFMKNGWAKSIVPYVNDWTGEVEDLKRNPTYGCRAENPNMRMCTKWIQVNGWKIPDDYPFKF